MSRIIALRLGRAPSASVILRSPGSALASRHASTESSFRASNSEPEPPRAPREHFQPRGPQGSDVHPGLLDQRQPPPHSSSNGSAGRSNYRYDGPGAGPRLGYGSSPSGRFGVPRDGETADNWVPASEQGSEKKFFGRVLSGDRRRDPPPSGFGLKGQGGEESGYRNGRDGRSTAYRDERHWQHGVPPPEGKRMSSLLPPTPNIEAKRKATENAIGGLSGTIVEEAKLDDFLGGFEDPLDSYTEPPKVVDAPFSMGRSAYASYEMPQESGVKMILDLLKKHEFLHTQEIWAKGTEGRRRPIPEALAYLPDGRIRMKSVSTMREGRRPYIPPAAAPFPDHPFRSTNFLKSTILHSLEEQGLIHKTQRERPFDTEEEHQAAIKAAERLTRKKERRAMWDRERHEMDVAMPLAREPASGVLVYGWGLGPSAKAEGQVDDEAWERAIRGEMSHHQDKAREALQAANRQFIRRERFRELKQYEKQAKLEDEELGITDHVQKERRRLEGLESIQHFAHRTGEDVSGWYEELGEGELGKADPWRPTHLQPGGVIARKGRTANMKPKGFPIV